jgi:[ribosomal protein S18]-alanine N-acetyltransferase
MEATIEIRRLEPGDAQAVMAIQTQCPELAQWKRQDYEDLSQHEITGWVASRQSGQSKLEVSAATPIEGFLVARQASGEIEILNLAVVPNARRQGVGRRLLETSLRWAKENGASQAFLEVRVSNNAAIEFYRLQGFRQAGRRKNYYQSPIEDALQLSTRIT